MIVFSSQRTMTLSIANLDPPGFTLKDCWKVTSLIGSVGLLQRWVTIRDGGNLNAGRESQPIFAKLSFFLVYPSVNVSEALQNRHGSVFFLKNHRLLLSDGWDECDWKGWRNGNLRLSIFKEDVLHANVTNWCCDGNAVGLAVLLIAFCQTNPLPSPFR